MLRNRRERRAIGRIAAGVAGLERGRKANGQRHGGWGHPPSRIIGTRYLRGRLIKA
jgi:hypothetical protein